MSLVHDITIANCIEHKVVCIGSKLVCIRPNGVCTLSWA